MRRPFALLVACGIIAAIWLGPAGATRQDGGTPVGSPPPESGTPIVDHFGCIFLADTGPATPVAGVDQRLWVQKTIIPPDASLNGTTALVAGFAADVLIAVEAPDTSGLVLQFETGGTVYFWDEGRCEDQTDVGCEEACADLSGTADTIPLDRNDAVYLSRTVPYNIFNGSSEDAVLWVAVISDDESQCPPCHSWP